MMTLDKSRAIYIRLDSLSRGGAVASRRKRGRSERGRAMDELLCFSDPIPAGHAFNHFLSPAAEPDRSGLSRSTWRWWRSGRGTIARSRSSREALYLESNTLSIPLLKRLEGLGHIVRTRDPDDERQVRVRLTDQGPSVRADAAHLAACVQEALGMSEGELGRLRAEVSTVRDRLLDRER